MADNVPLPAAAGNAAADEATYSGDTAKIQLIRRVAVTGTEGARTVIDADMLQGSGSLTASSQAVTLTLAGHANTTFQLSGTWVGTVTFEASNDNSNWTSIYGFKAGDSTIGATATTNDIYRCVTAGFGYVRARCSAYTSGTIVVNANATFSTGGVFQNFPLPPGTQDIGGVQARRDLVRIAVDSGGLTTATTAYTSGDQVGTQFTLANAARASGGTGTIVACTLTDAVDIIGAYDVVIFRSSVTLASDNAAFSISAADAKNAVAIIQLSGAWDIGSARVAQAFNLAIPYDCSGGTSLYAGLITRYGHTFFTAVTNLQLCLWVERN